MKLRGFIALPLAAAIAATVGCAQQPVAETSTQAAAPQATAPVTRTERMTAGVTRPDLSRSEVRRVQQALNSAGFSAGPVDGAWGPMTQNAVRNFQQMHDLETTGRLDRQTALALGFSQQNIAAFEIQPSLNKSDIRQVQQSLNQKGHTVGPVDGIWGPRTENALKSFQRTNGLEATGQLNRDTVLALGLPVSEFAAGEFRENQVQQQRQQTPREQQEQPSQQ